MKDQAEFHMNSSTCIVPCRRALDNVRAAAGKQNELDWFTEQCASPSLKMKLVNAYVRMCGVPQKAKKPKPFPLMQYQSQLRVQQSQLRDGISETMHEVAFSEFAKKPKNFPPRGLDVDSAKAEFEARCKDPASIVDFDGPSEKYRMRLGVKTKTAVTLVAQSRTCIHNTSKHDDMIEHH